MTTQGEQSAGTAHRAGSVGRRRTAIGWVGVAVALLAVVALAFWAGVTVARPVAAPFTDPGFVLVDAAEGSVSDEMAVNLTVTWPTSQTLVGRATGTVTAIHTKSGERVRSGDVLYEVDLRPVAVAEGRVPSFRDLSVGAHGPDVAGLQEVLAKSGHRSSDPRGRFGDPTAAAVRAWQRALGVEPDGKVRAGDILFVPSLPARIVLDPVVSVGADLVAGQPTAQVLRPAPTLRLELAGSQSDLVQQGTRVDVAADDGGTTTVARVVTTPDGQISAVLDEDGLCGHGCGISPARGEGLVPGTVVRTPETTGVVVPVTAVTTDASGRSVVTLADGTARVVSVVAQARGLVVVTGVEPGSAVRVWTSGDPAPPSAASAGAEP